MSNIAPPKPIVGPMVYENWLASLKKGLAWREMQEVPLFTDATITGIIPGGFGPYQFLNTVSVFRGSAAVSPAIVLRYRWHFELDLKKHLEQTVTDDALYHGGSLVDEVGALVSLALGIRVKAGSVTRIFELQGDPLGEPVA